MIGKVIGRLVVDLIGVRVGLIGVVGQGVATERGRVGWLWGHVSLVAIGSLGRHCRVAAWSLRKGHGIAVGSLGRHHGITVGKWAWGSKNFSVQIRGVGKGFWVSRRCRAGEIVIGGILFNSVDRQNVLPVTWRMTIAHMLILAHYEHFASVFWNFGQICYSKFKVLGNHFEALKKVTFKYFKWIKGLLYFLQQFKKRI